MSGECYLDPQNMHKASKDSGEKNKNMNDLLEYETVLSSAEDKCSQLNSQLEKIKQLYNNHSELPKFAQSNNIKGLKARIGSCMESYDKNINIWTKAAKKIRQNSQAIETDTSGAAMGTINNIFVGITKPIPMSDFIIPHKIDNSITSDSAINQKAHESRVHGVEDVKINAKSKKSMQKPKSKFNVKKSKSKVTTISSLTNCKKLKKSTIKVSLDKKRLKSSDSRTNKVPVALPNKINNKDLRFHSTMKNESKAINSTRDISINKNHDLVELYHNNAAKASKSSESDIIKKNTTHTERIQHNEVLVPPLNFATEIPGTAEETKNNIVSIYRNYTKPTISWGMKRVAKFYMNSFNIKCIPFCLSTSTSPSHNIGINIQQVMGMVKNKQPVEKLSPTLAYNIGLAAGKREDNTLPFLGSNFTSKSLCTQCPISKSTVNYHHLQEIAKSIPHEVIHEIEENEEPNSPEIKSIIITGPSGDVKVKNRTQTVWTADAEEKKCTCCSPKGTTFQQIINKFNQDSAKIKNHFINAKNDSKMSHVERPKKTEEITPLQNKEKKLKEVLGKLHDEFEKMNKTYEDLLKKNGEGDMANPNVTKELEELDKVLNSKEEEIIMVMSLYKEVLALKQQVKTLKERASRENTSIRSQPIRIKEDSNLATARLLNKLLQGVQYFQTHYKSR